jgi:L,D-peptidoglycan transpeptidase YkuD (ErfK/YbiS/YcfS/YnhG family)
MPYGASHETMRRTDRLYDVCLVLDWNLLPRRRARGSAIFFHLARPGFTPTQGCVAVTQRVMLRLLPLLSARTMLTVRR